MILHLSVVLFFLVAFPEGLPKMGCSLDDMKAPYVMKDELRKLRGVCNNPVFQVSIAQLMGVKLWFHSKRSGSKAGRVLLFWHVRTALLPWDGNWEVCLVLVTCL